MWEIWAYMINIRQLSSLILVILLILSPVFAVGQTLGSKSAVNGDNTGQSKLSASKQIRPKKVPAKSSNSGRDRGYANNLSNNARHDSGNFNDNKQSGNNDRHGQNHHGKWHDKINPIYAPYFYLGYYGYAPYNGYYSYIDPDYPLGYGTTMGTTLARPSNIEINQYLEQAPAPQYNGQGDSGAVYTYTEPAEDAVVEYNNPSPSEEQTIYVWVDESGVKNYANDIDFVPLRFRDIATVMGAE